MKERLPIHFDNEHIATGDDRKIALLEEVFQAFPNVAINIDLKEGHDDLIVAVDQLVRKYNNADLCIWGNRSESIARRCYKVVSTILYKVFCFYNNLINFRTQTFLC